MKKYLSEIAVRLGSHVLSGVGLTATVATCLTGFVVSASAQSIVVSTMDGLKAVNVSGLPNDTTALLVDYYTPYNTYGPDDTLHQYPFAGYGRGGGTFRWRAGVTASADGGRFVAPTVNSNLGTWERMLNGDSANVKMWGAKGDGITDDTVAIKNAIAAIQNGFGWSRELVFPAGTYVVTNTLVFNTGTHIRGESLSTFVVMKAHKDVFRTTIADHILNNISDPEWDHFLLFENLNIQLPSDDTTSAALVVGRPGEANSVKNIQTQYGAFGIRSLNAGAPGLRVRDCSTFYAAVAGISIEGNNEYTGGPVSLIGVSGDSPNLTGNESLVRIYKTRAVVTIDSLKAEQSFGGGVIQYYLGGTTTDNFAWFTASGTLSVKGATVNAAPNKGSFLTDFIVLKGDASRTASVLIEPANLYSVRYLIRDDVTGRKVDADVCAYTGLSQTALRIPTAYEGCMWGSSTNLVPRTRLVVGQTAISHLIPPSNGWYRVILAGSYTSGKLVISSELESTELHFDMAADGLSSTPSKITVTRASQARSGQNPIVTKARAGTYAGNGGWMSYVDVYVGNRVANPYVPKDARVTFALDINGTEALDSGVISLAVPQAVDAALPSGSYNSSGEVSLLR